MIAFPRFEEILEDAKIKYRLFKSPLNYLHILGHGRVFFRSMDAPARIIGYQHADADVDELDTLPRDQAAEVWRRILSRNRQKKPNGAPNTIGVTTTPEGFRFVYERWQEKGGSGYKIIRASTYSNQKNLPDGYIQSLVDSYPQELIDAYLNGKFVNLNTGAVYPNFCREKNSSTMTIKRANELIGKKAHLHIGMDFNINNMSAVVSVIVDGDPCSVDEIVGSRDTPSIIDTIKTRYDGHVITIYPDASGNNGSSKGAGVTDFAMLSAAGFYIDAPRSNPLVRDRVNAVNAMILDGSGRRRWKINPEACPVTVSDLTKQAYDKSGAPDKKSGNDHRPDALGYFIHQRYPIERKIFATGIGSAR
jgi:hypothetical protein